MDRRQYLLLASAVSTVGLSGCISNDDSTDGPEVAIKGYWEAIIDEDYDEFQRLLHPEIANMVDEVPFNDHNYKSVEDVETVENGINRKYLDDEGIEPYTLSMGDFQVIANNEEVALVDVMVESSGVAAVPFRELAATNDGDWFFLSTTI